MEIRKGIGVSPGVVISTAVVLDAEDLLVPRRQVDADNVPEELKRLTEALAVTAQELRKLRDDFISTHGAEVGKIFDFHLGLLKDKTLVNQITAEIKNNHSTAEYAVSTVMRRFAAAVQ